MEYYILISLLALLAAFGVGNSIYYLTPRKRLEREKKRLTEKAIADERKLFLEMKAKLLQGDLSVALNYFWSNGYLRLISEYLQNSQSFPLISEGWWSEINFRKLINEVYGKAWRLLNIIQTPNEFLSDDLRTEAWILLQYCVKSLWRSCHRLYLLHKGGYSKRQVMPALREIAADIRTVDELINKTIQVIGNCIARGGIYTELNEAKKLLHSFTQQARDRLEIEGNLKGGVNLLEG